MPIRLTRIYTRTGDHGETALVGGARVPKDSPRIEAYGTIDELNSIIGLARAMAEAGLDILDVVPVRESGPLAERLLASEWLIRLDGVAPGRGLGDADAELLEDAPERAADLGLILDDQYRGGRSGR